MAKIEIKFQEIVYYYERKEETQLLVYLTRRLKEETLTSSHDVETLFEAARKIKLQTPASFETIVSQIGLLKTERNLTRFCFVSIIL